MALPDSNKRLTMAFMVLVKGRAATDGAPEEVWPIASCLHSRGDGYVVIAYERALCALFDTRESAQRAINTLPPGMLTEIAEAGRHEP